MRRLTSVVAITVALLVVSAGTASADNPDFGRLPGGISVAVSQAGGPGANSEAGGSSGISCKYLEERYPTDGNISHLHDDGQWYAYICGDGANLWLGNLWVPAARPAVAPAVLAQEAYRWLPAPPPAIRTSPAAADQVVNVATWLWVDPATWGPRSATASVPNETATVTATPVRVTWTMGDGRRVVCSGPGTPYRGGDPAAASPDCGHIYRRSSAGQAGLAYRVTATTSWRISWVASGVVAASGTLPPLERTATTSLRVAEAQTVN